MPNNWYGVKNFRVSHIDGDSIESLELSIYVRSGRIGSLKGSISFKKGTWNCLSFHLSALVEISQSVLKLTPTKHRPL